MENQKSELDQLKPPASVTSQQAEIVIKKNILRQKKDALHRALTDVQNNIAELERTKQQILGQLAFIENLEKNGLNE